MKLFVIYIGGKTSTSLIELHDIRFVVANSIEDTYEEIRDTWWGTPDGLHLDCWGELNSVDGHAIEIKNTPYEDGQKLYFANLGGYDSNQFTELHENVFVVANNVVEAKSKALAKVKNKDWEVPHRDYLHEVENALCINDLLENKSLYIHLNPTKTVVPFEFVCQYTPI